jgi:hypothetical protein
MGPRDVSDARYPAPGDEGMRSEADATSPHLSPGPGAKAGYPTRDPTPTMGTPPRTRPRSPTRRPRSLLTHVMTSPDPGPRWVTG